jgi:hypothetical protein
MRHSILFCLPWLALALLAEAPKRDRPAPAPGASALAGQDPLDGGLPDPAWFGPGIAWACGGGLDFHWVRPGARLDRPRVYLAPWEPPSLPKGKDLLDHALGGRVSEALQGFLRERLSQAGGVQWAKAPEDTPYHAVGRVVGATHIRQGALATIGPLAGWPTHTWDFKVVDVRTGETLLATHHRAVGAGHFAWMQFVARNLAEWAGLPGEDGQFWAPPPDARPFPGGGEIGCQAGFQLGSGVIHLLPWTPDTDTKGLFTRVWLSGLGQTLASGMRSALARELTGRGFSLGEAGEASFLLQGRVYTGSQSALVKYRAVLLDAGSGKVVAHLQVPAPFAIDPLPRVAARVAEALLELGATPSSSPGPPEAPAALAAWEGAGPLKPGPGALDAVRVSPDFSLKGRTLQVGDWLPPFFTRKSDATDRAFASATTLEAPGWLLGSLTRFRDDGLRVSRTQGDLRLEGRVVDVREANPMNFGTAMAGAFTLGLATQSRQVFQIRIVEQDTGETRLLVLQKVVSFKVASSGTTYKAMKWMAQDFVPWLAKEGLSR